MEEKITQAILFADNYGNDFFPISCSYPPCLFPVANVPLIEYTLEWLSKNDVTETIICYSKHRDILNKYFENSRWKKSIRLLKMKVKTYPSSVNNQLEFIRKLEKEEQIKSNNNFILITNPGIYGYNLKELVQKHNENVHSDSNCLITIPFLQVDSSKKISDNLILILDKTNNRIIKYHDEYIGFFKLDFTVLTDFAQIEIHYDLCDTHLYICTPQTATNITDAFDYKFMQQDFLNNEVTYDDLNMFTYYSVIVPNGSYSICDNYDSYHLLNQKVIRRYTYPYVPDTFYDYSYNNHIYSQIQSDHICQTPINVSKHCVIGTGCQFSSGSFVERSVIGKNVIIGQNTKIINSYIFDNTKIGNDCCVSNSVIAFNCVIGNNCTLSKGTIVGSDCHILDSTKLESKPVTLHEVDGEKLDSTYCVVSNKMVPLNQISGIEEYETQTQPNDKDRFMPHDTKDNMYKQWLSVDTYTLKLWKKETIKRSVQEIKEMHISSVKEFLLVYENDIRNIQSVMSQLKSYKFAENLTSEQFLEYIIYGLLDLLKFRNDHTQFIIHIKDKIAVFAKLLTKIFLKETDLFDEIIYYIEDYYGDGKRTDLNNYYQIIIKEMIANSAFPLSSLEKWMKDREKEHSPFYLLPLIKDYLDFVFDRGSDSSDFENNGDEGEESIDEYEMKSDEDKDEFEMDDDEYEMKDDDDNNESK